MSALLNVDEIPEQPDLYQAGEVVTVTIERLVVTAWASRQRELYGHTEGDSDGHRGVHRIALRPGVDVMRLVPADGQPQPGDIWRDQYGGIWVAMAGQSASGSVELVDPTKPHSRRSVTSISTEYGPLARVASGAYLRSTTLTHRVVTGAEPEALT